MDFKSTGTMKLNIDWKRWSIKSFQVNKSPSKSNNSPELEEKETKSVFQDDTANQGHYRFYVIRRIVGEKHKKDVDPVQ